MADRIVIDISKLNLDINISNHDCIIKGINNTIRYDEFNRDLLFKISMLSNVILFTVKILRL